MSVIQLCLLLEFLKISGPDGSEAKTKNYHNFKPNENIMETTTSPHTTNTQPHHAPHGGKLVNRMVPADRVAEATERARQLPKNMIDLEAIITIKIIATGVLSPNVGFMTESDYKSVLEHGRLSSGVAWPVPLSFAPTGERNSEIINKLSIGDEVALVDANS